MKNIHLLPTDKPSRLWTNNLRRRLELDEFPEQHPTNIAKHIYITSNEKIKDGDWFINTSLNKPYQADASDVHVSLINEKKYCKKIILTTDQDLIKDGVQPIDDTFLEWFVNNPSCEWVKVEPREFLADKVIYEIIIPQEEKPSLATKLKTVLDNMSQEEFDSEWKKVVDLNIESPSFVENESKQETLEEVIKTYCKNKYGEGYYPDVEKAIGFGAKWQQERMYSEEDMVEFSKWRIIYEDENPNNVKHSKKLLKEWFEQHKKK
jgi:hypothetical protein